MAVANADRADIVDCSLMFASRSELMAGYSGADGGTNDIAPFSVRGVIAPHAAETAPLKAPQNADADSVGSIAVDITPRNALFAKACADAGFT